jgi:hypothetical protein
MIKEFLYGFYKPLKMVDFLKNQDGPALGIVT